MTEERAQGEELPLGGLASLLPAFDAPDFE